MLALMGSDGGDAQLVQIVDAAFADAARRAGDWLVCRPGCAQCCHGAFAIHPLDVARLQQGMATMRARQPALALEIERRAQAWIDEFAAEFPGDAQTGILADSDSEEFAAFANDAPCPALDPATGLCDVYEWRPMTCRVFGPPVQVQCEAPGEQALAHCELCFHGASEAEVAACAMQIPHRLEESLIDELGARTGMRGETTVAFALLGGAGCPPG